MATVTAFMDHCHEGNNIVFKFCDASSAVLSCVALSGDGDLWSSTGGREWSDKAASWASRTSIRCANASFDMAWCHEGDASARVQGWLADWQLEQVGNPTQRCLRR